MSDKLAKLTKIVKVAPVIMEEINALFKKYDMDSEETMLILAMISEDILKADMEAKKAQAKSNKEKVK